MDLHLLYRLDVAASELHLVVLIPSEVIYMRRAMHVTDQMQEVLDVDRNRRVRKVFVILQKLHGIIDGRNGISRFRIWRIP